jgi:hypothetical protein
MTKSYGLLIKSWDTVYQTPKEKYISMLITENAAGVSRRLEKMVGLRLNHSLKGQLRVAYHVFMQLCIKLIIMEESTKKIFKPKFNWFKNVMALFQYIWVSTLLRLYFKGQKSLEPPRKIIKCWWCVVQFLETLPLTHWELGLKNCARTKQGIFI